VEHLHEKDDLSSNNLREKPEEGLQDFRRAFGIADFSSLHDCVF